jgi:hypothetical protein
MPEFEEGGDILLLPAQTIDDTITRQVLTLPEGRIFIGTRPVAEAFHRDGVD